MDFMSDLLSKDSEPLTEEERKALEVAELRLRRQIPVVPRNIRTVRLYPPYAAHTNVGDTTAVVAANLPPVVGRVAGATAQAIGSGVELLLAGPAAGPLMAFRQTRALLGGDAGAATDTQAAAAAASASSPGSSADTSVPAETRIAASVAPSLGRQAERIAVAASTVAMMDAVLAHVRAHSAAGERVTVFAPGIVFWPHTAAIELLRRRGCRVIGYDVDPRTMRADAHHLSTLVATSATPASLVAAATRAAAAAAAGSPNAGAGAAAGAAATTPSAAAAAPAVPSSSTPTPSQATTTATEDTGKHKSSGNGASSSGGGGRRSATILITCSIRGRFISNTNELYSAASARHWWVVELRCPTIDAIAPAAGCEEGGVSGPGSAAASASSSASAGAAAGAEAPTGVAADAAKHADARLHAQQKPSRRQQLMGLFSSARSAKPQFSQWAAEPDVTVLSLEAASGGLGGAVAAAHSADMAAAMRETLGQLPQTPRRRLWRRLVQHVLLLLQQNRADYGFSVAIITIASRVAAALAAVTPLMAPLLVDAYAGNLHAAVAKSPVGVAARQQLRKLSSSGGALGKAVTKQARRAASPAAVKSVLRRQAVAGSTALSGVSDMLPRARAEATDDAALELLDALLVPSADVAVTTAPGKGTAVAGVPCRLSTAAAEWMARMLESSARERAADAEFFSLWNFVALLPAHVEVVSVGEPRTPRACVEASATSVVLRAARAELVVRMLRKQGFAAHLLRVVHAPSAAAPEEAFAGAAGAAADGLSKLLLDGSSVSSSAASSGLLDVLLFPHCPQAARYAKPGGLLLLPLSPHMSASSRRRLHACLAAMPPFLFRTGADQQLLWPRSHYDAPEMQRGLQRIRQRYGGAATTSTAVAASGDSAKPEAAPKPPSPAAAKTAALLQTLSVVPSAASAAASAVSSAFLMKRMPDTVVEAATAASGWVNTPAQLAAENRLFRDRSPLTTYTLYGAEAALWVWSKL